MDEKFNSFKGILPGNFLIIMFSLRQYMFCKH